MGFVAHVPHYLAQMDYPRASEALLEQVEIAGRLTIDLSVFFFKQKTAYEIGLGIPAEPLFRSENEKTVTQFCRKLAAERPLKDIRDEYNYPKKKGIKDECSRLLEASTMKSRRGFAIQRLMNAMRQAHADGWF